MISSRTSAARSRAAGALIAASLLLPGCGVRPDAVDPFQQNKRIGRGVNIIGYDPIWKSPDQARFKQRHFERIKAAGFDSVRINLHPFGHMDGEDSRLRESWLKTLDWAVKGALACRLVVILDCHEARRMGNNPEGNHGRFLSFWRQIGSRFRRAPSNVVFELLNEPSGKLEPRLWNAYLKEALAIVRGTNPNRTVVIGPVQTDGVVRLGELELPENDRNIIASIHYDSPKDFTHQGAPWVGRRHATGIDWSGSPEEKQKIVADFERAQVWAQANRRPLLLGEFGAFDAAPIDSRVRYTAFVARTAERLGWSWAYWQFDKDFVLFDMNNDAWVEPIRDALIPRRT